MGWETGRNIENNYISFSIEYNRVLVTVKQLFVMNHISLNYIVIITVTAGFSDTPTTKHLTCADSSVY